jgi:AcrR family transcriptional regulator
MTPSRGGLEPGRMVEIQRARILAAMIEVCVERGAANATVAHVVQLAGISRRTFYELFAGREDCFLAALDESVKRASRYVFEVYDPDARWAERIGMALTALLEFLDLERDAGWLLIVGSLGAGTAALERRQRVIAQITTVIDEGRCEGSSGAGATPMTAEGVVGAVLSVLHGRLCDEGSGRLVELAGPLMSMIVLPYLGVAASQHELSRSVGGLRVRDSAASTNPLKGLEMRLTYRTVRVLSAIGAHPGSSNRVIGDVSGILDQGQVSKLLARLGRLGLIENTCAASLRGDPNAWMLTKRGEEVHGAIAAE